MSGPGARALILDFGGVITRTLFETHRDTEQVLGLAAGTLSWRGPFDPQSDPLWRRMLSGEITERDYWRARAREVGRLMGEDWTEMSQLVRAVRGAEPDRAIRPEAREAVARCRRAGYRLAILSNELDLFYGADFRGCLPLLAEFDVISDASYSDILKPDPRAYRQCLEALGLPARRCVFVDDQRRNVDGARAVGLEAVHFDVGKPRESFQVAMRLLGVEAPRAAHSRA